MHCDGWRGNLSMLLQHFGECVSSGLIRFAGDLLWGSGVGIVGDAALPSPIAGLPPSCAALPASLLRGRAAGFFLRPITRLASERWIQPFYGAPDFAC